VEDGRGRRAEDGAQMKRREEYRARVTNDNGLVRGRVPCPLLAEMGARPGDYLTFRLDESNKVVMNLSRLRRKGGAGKKQGGERKLAGGKSRS
jgi:hypothetical protein